VNRRANPTIVGAFIIGAIALLVAGLVIFGSGSFFRQRLHAVAFFGGNIQGLNVGAPVNLRGVRVGTVTAIRIEVDFKTGAVLIPVYMEFDPKLIKLKDANLRAEDVLRPAMLKSAVDRGLRARLALQSFVTGQLLVDLFIEPNEPKRLVGAEPSLAEIPTSPSDIEKVKDLMAQLPRIADSMSRTLQDLDRVISSSDIPALVRSLIATANSYNALATPARAALDSVSTNVAQTAQSARAALATAETTLRDASTLLGTTNGLMTDDVKVTLHAATAALDSAERALTNVNTLVGNSQQRYDIDQILRNLSATSRALRSLSEELERRPNAVIMGK
jgi:paraquat-inducible protein B